MVRLDGVGLRYGAGPYVLRDLGFSLQAGEFRWLLGASGAGKTSLLRLLSLAVRPSAGRFALFDVPVETACRRDLPALRRRVGMVFQDLRLLPQLCVVDNVALPLRLAGRREAELRADVGEMLDWLGLADRAEVPPSALSHGEQQLVAVARAVVSRPSLLLADEPTGRLDDVQAGRLLRLLRELSRLGTAVVVATHNAALVARHPAATLSLGDGTLTQRGAPVADRPP